MKPPPFHHFAPATMDQALDMLSQLDNAKLFAGGQLLIPMLNMRYALPNHVMDLIGIAEFSLNAMSCLRCCTTNVKLCVFLLCNTLVI